MEKSKDLQQKILQNRQAAMGDKVRPVVTSRPATVSSGTPLQKSQAGLTAQAGHLAAQANHPSAQPGHLAAQPSQIPQKTTKKQQSSKRLMIGATIGIVAIAIIVTVVLLIVNAQNGEGSSNSVSSNGSDAVSSALALTTEEENKITKETLDKYAEVTIDGYKRVDNEDGLNDIVAVSVKNISDERTNLAIEIAAMDSEGNILDIASLYAEGIEPGQVQLFEAFALSELTPDQLKSAQYKVHRANTYTVEIPAEGQVPAEDQTSAENQAPVEEQNTQPEGAESQPKND